MRDVHRVIPRFHCINKYAPVFSDDISAVADEQFILRSLANVESVIALIHITGQGRLALSYTISRLMSQCRECIDK